MAKLCNVFKCLSGQKLANKMAEIGARKNKMVRIVSLYMNSLVTNGENPNDCQLGGALGFSKPLIPKILGFNCTAFTSRYGRQNGSGNYTGLLGHVQRDTADFSASPTNMPLKGDPVEYSPVVMSDRISFSTLYTRPQRPSADSDLLTSLLNIDVYSWTALIFIVSLMYSILLYHKRKNAMFSIYQCFLQRLGPEGPSLSARCLCWTMLTGFFILNQYYSNFILARIVRPAQPYVLKHFFDILGKNVDMCYSEEFPVYDLMKNSGNSKVRQISDVMYGFGVDKLKLEGGINGYKKFLGPPRERLFGLFGSYNRLEHTKSLTCYLIDKWRSSEKYPGEDQSLWVPRDSPHEFFKSLSYSKKIDKDVKLVLDLAVLRFFEHNLYGDRYYRRHIDAVREAYFQDSETPDHLCYSEKILTGEPDNNHGINLQNTDLIFICSALTYLVGFGLHFRDIFIRLEKQRQRYTIRRRTIRIERKMALAKNMAKKSSTSVVTKARAAGHVRVTLWKLDTDGPTKPLVTAARERVFRPKRQGVRLVDTVRTDNFVASSKGMPFLV
ncbi:hypothetical protein HDE_02087 [Halotydeus destructor]|nr:hypothetical protein HDE_02087 [Halotydeus destructor]